MKEQVEEAIEFDRLTSLPAWEKVLRFAGENVNGELIEATKLKHDAEKMRLQVVMWNAKRDLLDSIIGHIDAVQRERDRIVDEIKEMTDGGNAGN
jgi:hypothetical protein